MNKNIKHFLLKISSLNIMITCLVAFMVLVFVGTLAQVDLGIYYAQKKFFSSFFVYYEGFSALKIPIFPGGFLLGIILLINLTAASIVRLKWKLKNIGIIFTHVGLIFLLLGGGLTSALAIESQMAIREGETRNYSEDTRLSELVFIRTDLESHDEVTSIPESMIKNGKQFKVNSLPFSFKISRYLPNSLITMKSNKKTKNDADLPIISQGIGTQFNIQSLPVYVKDDYRNNTTIIFEIFEDNTSLGTWVAALNIGAPQEITVKNQTYTIAVRPLRYIEDYSLSLKDFKHDQYAGTTIPKNFSSSVHLHNPITKESRDVLIYMNHPFRYQGKTYFQASFGENDTLSVLQVVKNPSWLLPYISCLIITLGLILHFSIRLIGAKK